MVKSVENGTYLPPFLVKCYEMVDDESTDELISWTESNDSFIIHDESKFASQLLPKYFKHSKFPSFVRQLNIYGFRKIDSDRWQFANEAFIKGQKHLLKSIKRRKHPQSAVERKEAEPPPLSKEEKRTELWKEVENLKTDKNALMQELKKLRQHQQTSQSQLLLLRKQLKGMETNQQQMLSFIVMAMQSPEFLVQFFQPKENNWPGKTKLSEVTDDYEPTPNGMIVPYQPPKDTHPVVAEVTPEAAPNVEDVMEFDFSSDEMREIFMDIDFLFDEKLLPLETHPTQFVLPEIPENDAMLEQLLWLDPSTDNGHPSELEFDACIDSMPSTFPPEESDKSSGSDDGDENQGENMEALTKQMEHLK